MKVQTPSTRAPLPSSDPIAAVPIWPLVPLVFVSALVMRAIVGPFSSDLEAQRAYLATVFGTAVAWWLWAVARPTQRAGFQSSIRFAALKQAAQVGGCCVLATALCALGATALGLSHAGIVDAPSARASEPTMQATAWVVFLIGILAPIAEEMLFRGTMFRKWRLRWGSEKVALIVSGVFALGHANAPAVFLHALALTVLYTSTRTIWAPIAAHILNNLLPLLLIHTADFLPTGLLEAAMDWRWQFAAAIPASLAAWWLVQFVRRGWHTLSDPVHILPVAPIDIGKGLDTRDNALAVDQPGS